MTFQTPITIRHALDHIHRHDYVLPAIQREFVWRPEQIARLFDSLMQGYPIGSFLFWSVERDNVRQYKFYDFVRDYHQRLRPHCPPVEVPVGQSVIAVLDGQQRLTALNIRLRGSHAAKEPRKWWSSPDAFPEKRLYLNIAAVADENEGGLTYDFCFLGEERAQHSDSCHWFPVRKILNLNDATEIFEYIQAAGLATNRHAFGTLNLLHAVVHDRPFIAFFEESSQDLDKVLNIFIRTNSGGTVLSYSDLLLSIATAQWNNLDARQEIHGLVDDLNTTRFGFSLSKDFVLKAGLMLADIGSVGFNVTNFNHDNMVVLERLWRDIARALKLTIQLVADYGFSGQTLGADNALLPIAYSLYKRGLDAHYLSSSTFREDREAIRGWLVRSLLKAGVWGSGLDTLLSAIRTSIREQGATSFPVEAVEATMLSRGKGFDSSRKSSKTLSMSPTATDGCSRCCRCSFRSTICGTSSMSITFSRAVGFPRAASPGREWRLRFAWNGSTEPTGLAISSCSMGSSTRRKAPRSRTTGSHPRLPRTTAVMPSSSATAWEASRSVCSASPTSTRRAEECSSSVSECFWARPRRQHQPLRPDRSSRPRTYSPQAFRCSTGSSRRSRGHTPTGTECRGSRLCRTQPWCQQSPAPPCCISRSLLASSPSSVPNFVWMSPFARFKIRLMNSAAAPRDSRAP
jgi:hypothetical protein